MCKRQICGRDIILANTANISIWLDGTNSGYDGLIVLWDVMMKCIHCTRSGTRSRAAWDFVPRVRLSGEFRSNNDSEGVQFA